VLDDQREYTTAFDFTAVSENHYNHVLWPKGHPAAGQPMVLRDYQVEIINKFLTNPQCIQEVATGAGKTIITAALSDAVSPYGRSIVIVPNKSLVTQTEQDYINMQLDVGVYFGDRKEYNCQHTICTWQSLNNMMKLTAKGEAEITIHEFIQDVVCVIVDEVHMAKADALKTLLTGAMSQIPLRWGLTGTVPKEPFESQALLVSLGPVVSRLSASTLQDAGVLAQCHVNIVQLVDYVEYKDYQSELKYLLEESGRLDTMAELIRKVNETGNTLVLVDRTECGRQLVERLGEKAVFVSGATKGTKRQEEYDEVADATDKIIVATYGVAAVGINIPRIFNLVLIEPGKSFVRVIQSIGRGIRKAEDKDHVEIWDITSTCKFAKRHLTKRKQFYREAKYNFTQEKLEWMKIN
jgi:superfamily II DNA or RNA helicase